LAQEVREGEEKERLEKESREKLAAEEAEW
jgi:hypothetical protein